MKKLQKLSLKQIENTMVLLPREAQEVLLGGGTNDCFGRCVAYCQSAGATYSAADAANIANGYFTDGRTDFAVDHCDIGSYYASLGCSYNPNFSDNIEIRIFNTADNVGSYNNTGTWHAVVMTGATANGGATYFDPQSGQYGTFTNQDLSKTTYAGY